MRRRTLLRTALGLLVLGTLPAVASSHVYLYQVPVPGLKPSTPVAPPAPSVGLSQNALAFSSVSLGSTSSTLSLTLTNTGSVAVSVSTPTTSAPFATSTNCPTTLSAGANCTINVNFTPSVTGAKTGSLTVPTGAGNSSVTLSGAGYATIVASGSTRTWADGTYAPTCNSYLNPSTYYSYAGATGSGLYRVQPSGGSVMDVYCDMTNDGGGWTLVMRGQGANNIAGWQTTGGLNAAQASTTSAPTGTTFKLDDGTINLLRNGGMYRLIADGFTTSKRFVAPFTYSHTLVLTSAYYNTAPAITYATVSLTGALAAPAAVLNGGSYIGISDDQGNFATYFSTNRGASQGWSIGQGVADSTTFCMATSANCNFNMWVR